MRAGADLPYDVAEVGVSALDLSGGPHSRAARTARFNEKKAAEKAQGKLARDRDLAERASRKKEAGEWVDIA